MILPLKTLVQNRYLIVQLIAQGGMGAVYRATDRTNSTTVALKQSLVHDETLNKAFEREARILSRLRHSSLPTVSDYFLNESGQFLVMQYIPGDDLGAVIERKGKQFLTPNVLPWVLRWFDQLLDALTYLHGQEMPIIHRDIKPQNLKLTSSGEIVLLDFGMAKSAADQTVHSAVYSVRGYTPQYAPLEQIQGTGTDERSDLYSLAATFYHLLTGEDPPDSLTRVSARLTGQSDPLRPASERNPLVPPGVAMVLQQAMEQEMAHRFASANAMRTAMRMAIQSGNQSPGNSSGQQTIVSPSARSAPTAKHEEGKEEDDRTVVTDKGTSSKLPYPMVTVSPKDQGDYRTISDAIANVKPGTHIVIYPGVYKESIILDKPVFLSGEGPLDQVVIESRGATTLLMRTDYARLRNITFRARVTTTKENRERDQRPHIVAVDVPQGRLVMEECDISCESVACVAIHGESTSPLFWRCKIHDSHGTGIFVYDKGNGTAEECDIFRNALAGIRVSQASNFSLHRCLIHHGRQEGIHINERSRALIEECDIFDNERMGVEIKQESSPILIRCKIHNQTNGDGVVVHQKGRGILEGCNIFSNAETGIRITQNGNPLIRQCTIHHERQRAILVFENGKGTFEECDIFENIKTSVNIGQDGNPTFRNCQIRNGDQGGVLVWDEGKGLMEDCAITGNAQAGVEIRQHSNPCFRRCSITNNKMMGVLVHKQGAGIVEECDLTGNNRAWYVEEGCMVMESGNRE